MTEAELKEIEELINGEGYTLDYKEAMEAAEKLLKEVKRLRGMEHFCYDCHSDHSYGECPKP